MIKRFRINGCAVMVETSGASNDFPVVLIGSADTAVTAYSSLCQRLHLASFRTIVIGSETSLECGHVNAILDKLKVQPALLVGDGIGAELAWRLAASSCDRFIGLVAIDHMYPRATGVVGHDAKTDCSPIVVNTTIVVSATEKQAMAALSRPYVQGDLRVVNEVGVRHCNEWVAQLAAEIVMRIVAY